MTHLSIFQVCQIYDIKYCVRKTDKRAGLSDFRKRYYIRKTDKPACFNFQTCMF